jgi:purine nucleosidase
MAMRRIILDTDLAMGTPGSDIDDGFALALALADPGLRIELVTTVHGNTDVDTATRLTLELLNRLDHGDIPVIRGSALPLRSSSPRPEAESAGEKPSREGNPHASVVLAERVMAEPGKLTIVAIGPLTNIALALLLDPGVADAVQEIVVMGGVFLGQTNDASMPGEFNTWTDPDATAAVLASGAPLRFVGLDVTRKVRLTRDDTAAMASSGTDFARFAALCADEWIALQDRPRPTDDPELGSCALHDPLAVAVVTNPELVTWKSAYVAVETSSPITRGVMVADMVHADGSHPDNCQIATAVDAEAFRRVFLQRMATLP